MIKVEQNTRKKFAKLLLWSILILESAGLVVPGAHSWFMANNIYVLSVFFLLVYLLRPLIEGEALLGEEPATDTKVPADDKYATTVAELCMRLCDDRIEEVVKGTMTFRWSNAYFYFLKPLLSQANAIQAVDMTPIEGWQTQQQLDYISAHNSHAGIKERIRIYDAAAVLCAPRGISGLYCHNGSGSRRAIFH